MFYPVTSEKGSYRSAKCLLVHFWVFLQKLCNTAPEPTKRPYSQTGNTYTHCNRLIFEFLIMPGIKLDVYVSAGQKLDYDSFNISSVWNATLSPIRGKPPHLSRVPREERVGAHDDRDRGPLRPLRGFPLTQNQPAVFRTLLHISHCLRHSPKCQSWALFDCSFLFFLRAGWAPGVSLVRSIKVNGDMFTHMGWRPNLQKNSHVSAVRLWHSPDVLMAFNGQLNDCYYPFVLLNRTLWTCLCMAL